MLHLLLQTTIDGLLLGLIYAVTALGLSLVLGMMGIVNMAHSAFIMLGSFFALTLFDHFRLDPIVSFFLIIPVFFAVGFGIYLVMITRVERAHQTQSLVAMFGLMVLIENFSTIIWTTDTRVITSTYTNAGISIGSVDIPVVRVIAATLSFALICAVWALLRFTLTGKAIRAIKQQRDAAQSIGINVRRLSATMFGLAVACAGCAGVVLGMSFPFAPQTQIHWLAWAFLVVILGGFGKVENTLAAAFVVGLVQAISTIFLPFDYVYLLLYVVLATILILRREGLSGAIRRSM